MLKHRLSDNVVPVKYFLGVLTRALRRARHCALVEDVPAQPKARSQSFQVRTQSDHLLGASARRMLKALAEGETNPVALAAMADKNLRATQAQLCDALGACTELEPIYRRLLKMFL